jgi:hypothetical protein
MRWLMDYSFPDHWSFLLGEIAQRARIRRRPLVRCCAGRRMRLPVAARMRAADQAACGLVNGRRMRRPPGRACTARYHYRFSAISSARSSYAPARALCAVRANGRSVSRVILAARE